MTKPQFWRYFKLAISAFFLLNFSTICVICLFKIAGPIINWGGGFFQNVIWNMMFKEISSDVIIITIRILLFLSSVYFWFKKQNWFTAAYLIIAGTGAGLLSVYFFALPYLSLLGCLAVLIFCFCVGLCYKFVKRLCGNPKIQTFITAWKNFWTTWKIATVCIICGLILIERFIPWKLPIFGKPLPYVVSGYAYSGRIPPYEYDITISVDVAKSGASQADIAATCASAARYFTETYGFPAIRISIYDYISENQKFDECYYELGACRYSPHGFYLYDSDKNLQTAWSYFRVARDIPLKEIRECNSLMLKIDKKITDMDTRDKIIRKEMGHWSYSKLDPDFMDVKYGLLSKNFCQKPESVIIGHFPISRKNLIDECESLYTELKVIGAKPDFPQCYESGCGNNVYKSWVRRKYMLWSERKGNFNPDIIPYNSALDALAKAYAQRNEENIIFLTANIDKIIAELKKFNPCDDE